MAASAVLCSSLCGTSLPLRQSQRPSRTAFTVRRAVVCHAERNEDAGQGVLPKVLSVPMAAALAGILMTSAVVPEEALAARSSGRVGGSSFKSAPRSAPSGSRTTVRSNTYNTYVAPPVSGYGYGYGGYGGGISFFPSFYTPPLFGFGIPVNGGFLSLLFTMFAVSAVFGVVRGALSSRGKDRRDDKDWD